MEPSSDCQVFVYEFLTGGGMWSLPGQPVPAGSFCVEGRAMRDALCADLARLSGCRVLVTLDARLPHSRNSVAVEVFPVAGHQDHEAAFDRLSAVADWSVIIAPEMDGLLSGLVRRVEANGGRLLSPDVAVVELASDKHRTAEWLSRFDVPTPAGLRLNGAMRAEGLLPGPEWFPAVLKPVDGAGSLDVVRIDAAGELRPAQLTARFRLERYVPGTSVSVAALAGPGGSLVLPPCRQRLSDDGRFGYQGGRLPLQDEGLATRAHELAKRAFSAMGATRGYLGVDLVLADDGPAGDVVVDVNPRLTTSYVGLRALTQGNLAECMLRLAHGERVELLFLPGPVEFDSGGQLT